MRLTRYTSTEYGVTSNNVVLLEQVQYTDIIWLSIIFLELKLAKYIICKLFYFQIQFLYLFHSIPSRSIPSMFIAQLVQTSLFGFSDSLLWVLRCFSKSVYQNACNYFSAANACTWQTYIKMAKAPQTTDKPPTRYFVPTR